MSGCTFFHSCVGHDGLGVGVGVIMGSIEKDRDEGRGGGRDHSDEERLGRYSDARPFLNRDI